MFDNPRDILEALDSKGTRCPRCFQWVPANSFHGCKGFNDVYGTGSVVQMLEKIISLQETMIQLLESIESRPRR